jgi:hypothetical protein
MPRRPKGRWGNSFLAKSKKRKIDPNRRKAKTKSTSRGRTNDRDPYRFHATQADADQDAIRLKNVVDKTRDNRVPTFYTILQDKRKGVPRKNFGSVPQGPHTIPHHYTLDALVNARENNRLREISGLRPDPGEFKHMVYDEIPKDHPKRRRAKVAVKRYERLFEKADLLLTGLEGAGLTEAETIKLVHTLNKGLQMHPFLTYAYKGKGAGKNALKYKNESRLEPVKLDMPTKPVYNDMTDARTVIDELLEGYRQFHP